MNDAKAQRGLSRVLDRRENARLSPESVGPHEAAFLQANENYKSRAHAQDVYEKNVGELNKARELAITHGATDAAQAAKLKIDAYRMKYLSAVTAGGAALKRF